MEIQITFKMVNILSNGLIVLLFHFKLRRFLKKKEAISPRTTDVPIVNVIIETENK